MPVARLVVSAASYRSILCARPSKAGETRVSKQKRTEQNRTEAPAASLISISVSYLLGPSSGFHLEPAHLSHSQPGSLQVKQSTNESYAAVAFNTTTVSNDNTQSASATSRRDATKNVGQRRIGELEDERERERENRPILNLREP